jgi:ATP/maltotriose-dependent transcriptional regulator MalT
VHQGQFWANTEQMGYVIEALSSASSTRVISAKGDGLLTLREDQVVNLVAEGIGNRDITQQFGIEETTDKKSLLDLRQACRVEPGGIGALRADSSRFRCPDSGA